jgi:transposase-like protein
MAANNKEPEKERSAEMAAAVELVRLGERQWLELTVPDGLLKQFTKTVLETALDEEMSGHPGRTKHEKTRNGRSSNARNGTVSKMVITNAAGPVEITVPRDRDASFEPVIVKKPQRRLNDVDEVVLSLLYAKDQRAFSGDLRRGGIEGDN